MARPSRRQVLGAAAGAVALSATTPSPRASSAPLRTSGRPVMIGSANALAGMRETWERVLAGAAPLDAAIDTVKGVEADPEDTSVGLGGLPNEDGVVQLDAACMDGRTHNGGGVGALENILHPSEVARLVMERTDHCLLVGRGAYDFARAHGHEHVELLTEKARKAWLEWKERMSDVDDRLPPPAGPEGEKHGMLLPDDLGSFPRHGTIHCSVLSSRGDVACTTTTSGLAFKIPGRVGDSPLLGCGLYCDQEAGSAGSTGRGEAAILSHGSSALIELLRQGLAPLDAGMELLRRIVRQTERMSAWQPGLMVDGRPSFGVNFYVLSIDGRWAGVTLQGRGKSFSVADTDGGPRHEELTPLLD